MRQACLALPSSHSCVAAPARGASRCPALLNEPGPAPGHLPGPASPASPGPGQRHRTRSRSPLLRLPAAAAQRRHRRLGRRRLSRPAGVVTAAAGSRPRRGRDRLRARRARPITVQVCRNPGAAGTPTRHAELEQLPYPRRRPARDPPRRDTDRGGSRGAGRAPALDTDAGADGPARPTSSPTAPRDRAAIDGRRASTTSRARAGHRRLARRRAPPRGARQAPRHGRPRRRGRRAVAAQRPRQLPAAVRLRAGDEGSRRRAPRSRAALHAAEPDRRGPAGRGARARRPSRRRGGRARLPAHGPAPRRASGPRARSRWSGPTSCSTAPRPAIQRALTLLRDTKTIVVPVVNPDGFNISREAGQLRADFGYRYGDPHARHP